MKFMNAMKKIQKPLTNEWLRMTAIVLVSALLVGIISMTTGNLPKGHNRSGLYYEVTGLRPDGILLKIDGEPITVEEYLYWVANDSSYLMNYAGVEDLTAPLTEEMTYADYVRSDVLTTLKLYGSVRAWAKSAGVTLTEAQQAELSQQRQTYVEYYGGEDAYLQQLSLLGITQECFDQINATPYLYNNLLARGSDPADPLYPGEAALRSFINDHGMATVQLVYLSQEQAWSAEDLEEFKTTLADLSQQLQEAEDPDAVLAQAQEELGLVVEPLTFALTENDPISEATQALEEGQWSAPVTDGADYYLIRRMAPDLTQTAAEYMALQVEEHRDNAVVVYNSDLYDKIDIAAFYPALFQRQQEISPVQP